MTRHVLALLMLAAPPMTVSRGCEEPGGPLAMIPMAVQPLGAWSCKCDRTDWPGCGVGIPAPIVQATDASSAAQQALAAMQARAPWAAWSCSLLDCVRVGSGHHEGRTSMPDPCADAGADGAACGQPCDGSAGQCEAHGCLGCDLASMTCAGMP